LPFTQRKDGHIVSLDNKKGDEGTIRPITALLFGFATLAISGCELVQPQPQQAATVRAAPAPDQATPRRAQQTTRVSTPERAPDPYAVFAASDGSGRSAGGTGGGGGGTGGGGGSTSGGGGTGGGGGWGGC
jgi:uncharacterized membrane protein YgcG